MFRKTVSLTSLLSFVVMLATSVVLYIEPHGRTAYWADWRFMGLSKTAWDNLHLTMGTLFLVCAALHIWLNWKPVTNYMRNKARELVVGTKPMLAALGITLFVGAGTFAGLPPMQQILDFGASIKDGHASTYGSPPYGHAEQSPLEKFCGYLGFDVDKAIAALEKAGYANVAPDMAIQDIARTNNASPQKVYDVIRDELVGENPFAAMPAAAPEGTGKLTLEAVCATFGLPMEQAMQRLRKKGFSPAPDKTFKDMAQERGSHPRDVYAALRGN